MKVNSPNFFSAAYLLIVFNFRETFKVLETLKVLPYRRYGEKNVRVNSNSQFFSVRLIYLLRRYGKKNVRVNSPFFSVRLIYLLRRYGEKKVRVNSPSFRVRLIYLLRRYGEKKVRVNLIRIKASFLHGNCFYNQFYLDFENRSKIPEP